MEELKIVVGYPTENTRFYLAGKRISKLKAREIVAQRLKSWSISNE